jgi:HlyD family secretion protein
MVKLDKKWLRWGGIGVAAAAVAFMLWHYLMPSKLGDAFASGNGRIEAVEIDVSAKIAGRVRDILVNEGDFVTSGQVVALMDTDVLEAQKRQAEAQLRQARSAIESAKMQVTQRQSEKQAVIALVTQREAEADAAHKYYVRSEPMVPAQAISLQQYDENLARHLGAKAALSGAHAQVAAAEAAIATARSQVIEAESTMDAVQATIERLQADIDDSSLKAPRDGRVQYRVAELNEVVGAGGRVLNMVDLSDVHMTFFLPTEKAGRVMLGGEAHLVLDALPQYVLPARITFVSDVAQFTPKTVETESERLKLMFRIKAQIDPELLKKYIRYVKVGLPGMAYVQLDPKVEWPPRLQVKIPE